MQVLKVPTEQLEDGTWYLWLHSQAWWTAGWRTTALGSVSQGNGVGPALRHCPQALTFLSWLADLGNQGLPPSLTVLADRLINQQTFFHQQDPPFSWYFISLDSSYGGRCSWQWYLLDCPAQGCGSIFQPLLSLMSWLSGNENLQKLPEHLFWDFVDLTLYQRTPGMIETKSFLSPEGHFKCFYLLWSHLYHGQ